MKRSVIIGNGMLAIMLAKYICQANHTTANHALECFAVDKEYILANSIDGVSVVPFEHFFSTYNSGDVSLYMGIGYKKMGKIREEIYIRCKEQGFSFSSYVHPSAIIFPDILIGEGNIILEGVIVEAGCNIGNCNLFYGKSMLGHDSQVGNFNTFSVNATTAGGVMIKSNCFIGASATIKDGITLDDGVFVGAGAYAWSSIDKNKVVMPAKGYIREDIISTDIY